MADINKKLGDDALEAVSGGKEGKFSDVSQCPPGTRECKNPEDYPGEEGHHKHCPYCGSNEINDRFLFVPDWQACFEGQECRKCGKAWRTKGHGIS